MHHGPHNVVVSIGGLAHHPPPVVAQGVEDGHRAGPALQPLPHVARHAGDVVLDAGGEGAEDDRALSQGALHQDELIPALVPDILAVVSAELLAGLGVLLISIVMSVKCAESLRISPDPRYCEAGIGSH